MKVVQKRTYGAFVHWVTAQLISLAMLAAFVPGLAHAVPPPANAVIGNQAMASYVDGTGNTRTATSNLVQTTVQQVYSHDLIADNVKIVAANTMVYFSHTLSNTGNGVDSFTLSMSQLSDDAFDLENPKMYADSNGDGVPDNNVPITSSGPLDAGQVFKFVISSSVGNSEVDGAKAKIRVGAVGNRSDPNNYEASSTPPSGNQKGNTNTATVSNGAVLNLQQSYSKTSGPASTTLNVSLFYMNYGSKKATQLVITDTIGDRGRVQGVPFDTRQMSYVANSTRIDGVAVNDNSNNVTFSNNKLTINLPDLQPNVSGTVRFTVQVNNATPGAEQTTNVAGFSWSGGVQQATNAVSYKVQRSGAAGVALGDSRVAGASGGSEKSSKNNLNGPGAGSIADVSTLTNPSDSAGVDNGILLNEVPQGGSPVFHTILTNTGGTSDRFNLTVENVSYPPGTRFILVDAAGVPLTDSTGDGITDSGPLSSNMARDVFVRVSLPANAITPAAGWTANLKANSTNNSGVSDLTSLRMAADSFVARTVDVRNTSVTGPGSGFASGNNLETATLTGAGNPGQSVSFKLWVTNGGANGDNYELQSFGAYSVYAGAADSTGALPAGWTVKFMSTGNSAGSANCLAAGAVASNTGNIVGGGSCEFDAVVTIPAGYAAGTQALFFRAWSKAYALDGASNAGYDVIRNDVTVNSLTSITLAPNGASQISSGGTVFFSHQLCNTGNENITAAGTAIASTHTDASFTNTLYVDANGNGQPDSNEQIYVAATNGALAKATATGPTCIKLVNKVMAPAGVSSGVSNTGGGRSLVTALPMTFGVRSATTFLASKTRILRRWITMKRGCISDCALSSTKTSLGGMSAAGARQSLHLCTCRPASALQQRIIRLLSARHGSHFPLTQRGAAARIRRMWTI